MFMGYINHNTRTKNLFPFFVNEIIYFVNKKHKNAQKLINSKNRGIRKDWVQPQG